ncbi:hypothetical protein MTO96_036718 [Rhipicephalus appendiculatus]
MEVRQPSRDIAFAAGVTGDPATSSLPASHPHQPTRTGVDLPTATCFDGCNDSGSAATVAAAGGDGGLEPPRDLHKVQAERDQQ